MTKSVTKLAKNLAMNDWIDPILSISMICIKNEWS